MIEIPAIVWVPMATGAGTWVVTYLYTKYKNWENIKKHVFGF